MIRFENELGHSEYWYDCADVSKTLMVKDANGKIFGRNKFMQWLRHNGVIMMDSNQPKQNMITLGLMRYHMVIRRYKRYGMPLFSDRGINYLQRRIASGEFTFGLVKKTKIVTTVKLEDVC